MLAICNGKDGRSGCTSGRTWDARGLNHDLEEVSSSPKALRSSVEAFLADMLDVQVIWLRESELTFESR